MGQRGPRLPELPPLRRARSATARPEPTAARTLVGGAVCAGVAVATVAWSIPVGQQVRDAVCGSGPGSCAPPLYRVADLGRCTVVSRADTVAEDAVVFADDVRGTERLQLTRSVDRDAVVTWSVREDGVRPGISEIRTFADRRSADDYTLAVARGPGRRAVAEHDGTGLAAWFGNRIDGGTDPGTGSAAEPPTRPPPSALVVDGATTSDLPASLQPPAVPGPGPGGPPLLRRWSAGGPMVEDGDAGTAAGSAAGDPDPDLDRVRTVWTLDWSAVQRLTLASPGGEGRAVLALVQNRSGQPLRLEVEAAGDLAARLAPATSGEALTGPLARRPGDPSTSGGTHTGRLVISLDLVAGDSRDLAAALTDRLGAPLFTAGGTAPAGGVGAAEEDLRDLPAPEQRARRQQRLATLTGLLTALDRGEAGASVTLHSLRPTGDGPPRALVTSTGQTGFADALPAADYYLDPTSGFVRWQECTP